jgi:hypothetical protein
VVVRRFSSGVGRDSNILKKRVGSLSRIVLRQIFFKDTDCVRNPFRLALGALDAYVSFAISSSQPVAEQAKVAAVVRKVRRGIEVEDS